jgi:F-type H+-transporting ATPase subunit epsilon
MFTLTLVTPEKKLVAGQEIEEVFVPAFRGELNVLPGHAPLMTTLTTGILRYRFKGEAELHYVAISSGYCEVSPLGVNILAETAEQPQEIDVERVEQARVRAEKMLIMDELSSEAFIKHQNKLARAQVRKEVASYATKQ